MHDLLSHTASEHYYFSALWYPYYCLGCCSSYWCWTMFDARVGAPHRQPSSSTLYSVEMPANICLIHAIHCPLRIDGLGNRYSFRHPSNTATPACINSIIIKTIYIVLMQIINIYMWYNIESVCSLIYIYIDIASVNELHSPLRPQRSCSPYFA